MKSWSDVRTRLAAAAMLAILLNAWTVRAEISARDLQVLTKSQLIFIATVRKIEGAFGRHARRTRDTEGDRVFYF